jgi:Fic family protein
MIKPVLKEISGNNYLYIKDTLKVNSKSIEVLIYVGRIENVTLNAFMDKLREMQVVRLKKYIDARKESFEPAILTPDEVRDLDVMSYYRAEYLEYFPDESARYEQSLFVRYVHGTTAIEGNTISERETAELIDHGISPSGKKVSEIFEITNYLRLRTFLQSYQGPLNEKLVLKIHAILMENLLNSPGEYRQISVSIGKVDYEPPAAFLVPHLIQDLMFWYKSSRKTMHPFELAMVFHARFEMIHPFADGNGRVGRALMNFILERAGYTTLSIGMSERTAYLDALVHANHDDFKPIVKTMFTFYAGQNQKISGDVKAAMGDMRQTNRLKPAIKEFARLKAQSGSGP